MLKSVPHFALGMLLILLFALQLDWLPSAGHGELRHFLLPALTLALSLTAVGVRVVREATGRWCRPATIAGERKRTGTRAPAAASRPA